MPINLHRVLRRYRAARADGGFTLLEVMVGLAIVLIVTASLVPLLITGAVASQTAKLSTEAKNLTTQRLDSMRSLPFHVSSQNGPFVDVLDEYYANSLGTTTAITATGGTGQYYASAVVPGQKTATPNFLVTFSSTSSPNPLPTGFTQSVYTQFLTPNSQGGTTPTGDQVITPPSNYNNTNPTSTQTDSPPSDLIGITVVTTYSIKGKNHSYNVFTELSDTGHDAPLVVAEAGVEALHLSSQAYDGTSLDAVIGQIGGAATLSNESTATDSVVDAAFTHTDPTGATTYPGLTPGLTSASVNAPPNTTTASAPTSNSAACVPMTATGTCGGGNCGWGSVDTSSYTDVGATVATAQPRVPQDVESGGTTQFAVTGGGLGIGGCGGVSMTNVLTGSPALNPALVGFNSSSPIVYVGDTTGSQNVMSGSAQLDTPHQVTSPVTSSASITYNTPIYLFPGVSSDSSLPDGSRSFGALLAIVFTSPVSISCNAQQANATAAYAGTIYLWQQTTATNGAYQTYTFNYNSGSPQISPTDFSKALGSTSVGYSGSSTIPLSNYLTSFTVGNIVQQQPVGAPNSNVGVHTIPEAISIVTQPILSDGLSDGGLNTNSDIVANIGNVSCASEDYR